MDHRCHKCGYSIEDGKPFCSQCGAPQIRVATPEPSAPLEAGNISTRDLPVLSMEQASIAEARRTLALSSGIVWSAGIRASALAALISIAVMSFRLISPLLALLCSGILAVTFYNRRNPGPRLNARTGAQLGAATGLICSGISGIFFAIFMAVLRAGGEIRQVLMDQLQQFASRSNDPQVQATFDLLKTPEGMAKVILAMVGFFLISIAAASIAGALTGVFLGRRNRP
jgi:hypothetical protein